MKVLHINSNFLYTDIYENLLDNLNDDVENVIFNPVKEKNIPKVDTKYEIYKPSNIKKSDSIFTFSRMKRSLKYIEKNISLNHEKLLIHAHSMTNDGLLAYKIFKKYHIPYILTIRNTDINFTMKYKKHLKFVYANVVIGAKSLVFPNYSYKNKMKEIFRGNKEILDKLKHAHIIPNGVDEFWHNNYSQDYKEINIEDEINILFVGRIYRQKNLHRVIEAIELLNKQKFNLKYNVVGNIIDKEYFEKLKRSNVFNYLGVKNKEEVLSIMKENELFIMPSENETFGLVYVEAISQNLPILFTENEGIDQYFPENKYGVAVNAYDVNSIQEGIVKLIRNYENHQNNMINKKELSDFKWKRIGMIYTQLYKGI
ncbi:glycosyltransferase family 4 protein [Staphylococcus saprophyticus]|uniref:glycosyltransferase family 4 protein n=1 Tax=Staphylococcus saprophyticus TaxID=29385 RepID=UPI0008532B13|nr:glycosyltransferase family 4 protein [Staphylococcus saprophyticus]MDW4440328.1 glycosyltransferase family 4 protein [Staphylococcus saprophyticus]OEK46983.1 hypothetical protein ASS92_02720 [Staphylococcus saprophyticus]WFR69743.1 glycosyltransferase family 4 protein [Staphylococcus saprophyticus]